MKCPRNMNHARYFEARGYYAWPNLHWLTVYISVCIAARADNKLKLFLSNSLIKVYHDFLPVVFDPWDELTSYMLVAQIGITVWNTLLKGKIQKVLLIVAKKCSKSRLFAYCL